MKKEKKSHFNVWIYVIITICILSSSIAYSALNASVKITGDVVIEKPKNILYDKVKENAVMDNIRSTYVSSDTGINFKAISSNTNGKGVYERKGTENQQYPIYYYRGEVDNNYVIFANYCWKIVRTTETGGIKLIFYGMPWTNSCDNPGNDSVLSENDDLSFNSFEGVNTGGYIYTYPTLEQKDTLLGSSLYGSSVSYSGGTYTLNSTSTTLNDTHHYSCDGGINCSLVKFYVRRESSDTAYYILLGQGENIDDAVNDIFKIGKNSSNVKKYIEDTWYKNHMTSYSDRLEDTVWCNDQSIYSEGGWSETGKLNSPLYFGSYERISNGTPSLTCPREEDRLTVGNGRLQYKTGLLTADEAILAGGQYARNTTYYLFEETDYPVWLGSPYSFDGSSWMYAMSSSGFVEDDSSTSTGYIRPSVSLKAGTKYQGGNGTVHSPYIVE